MGALAVMTQALKSRFVQRILGSLVTKLLFSSSSLSESSQSGGGFWQRAMNAIRQLVLGKFLRSRAVIWAVRQLLPTIEFLANFNWNATDKEIQAAIDARNAQLGGVFGSAVGSTLGWTLSIALGGGASFSIPVIGGRDLMKQVMSNLTQEAVQSLVSEYKNVLQQTVNIAAMNLIAKGYMAARGAIKKMPNLEALFGEKGAKWVRQDWGKEGGEEISFVKWRDDKIESIKSPFWQSFAEEAVDSFWDSFSEGVYLVADELDSALNAAIAAQNEMERNRTMAIELVPDRDNPREKFVLSGKTTAEIRDKTETALQTYSLVHNRDVGYVGVTQDEGLWMPEYQRQRLTLISYSVKAPPWNEPNPNGSGTVRAAKRQINIPNPKRSITWDQVKLALGGASGYDSGAYYAVGRLNSRRKIVVYGATESEARSVLESVAELSEDRIMNITIGSRDRFGGRQVMPSQLRKRVYPAYAITAKLRLSTAEEGRIITEGLSYAEDRDRVELWRSTKPENANFFS